MTQPIPTTERLAAALAAAGASPLLIKRARDGYYDDFKSDLTLPCIELVNDLGAAGLMALRERAIAGEFDGTPEESEAWMEAQGVQHFSPSVLEALGYKAKPQGFGK